jgi:PhnB protein
METVEMRHRFLHRCFSSKNISPRFGDKGKIKMPVQETFWAARFGMLTDKFGINWMFNFGKPQQ